MGYSNGHNHLAKCTLARDTLQVGKPRLRERCGGITQLASIKVAVWCVLIFQESLVVAKKPGMFLGNSTDFGQMISGYAGSGYISQSHEIHFRATRDKVFPKQAATPC